MEPVVEVVPVPIEDKPILQRLVELYMYDFSEFNGRDVNAHGSFGYRYLDHYWTEDHRHPLLLRSIGRWCGFALVATGRPNRMAEFFVMKKYRRAGIGTQAARLVLERFPGRWTIEQVKPNVAAREFWRQAIPVEFVEQESDEGWEQSFLLQP